MGAIVSAIVIYYMEAHVPTEAIFSGYSPLCDPGTLGEANESCKLHNLQELVKRNITMWPVISPVGLLRVGWAVAKLFIAHATVPGIG